MSEKEEVVASVAGACLCGVLRFEVVLPVVFCAHCHCSICRRGHGAGYVTWIGAAKERFRIVGGEDKLRRYRSSEHGIRSFCGRCGSTLFCELENHPGLIDVVLANMEGDVHLPAQMHVFYSDRAAWTELGDDLPRLGGTTGMEPLS